jgi:hypothetical protein
MCLIKVDGSTWAGADFDYKQTRSKAGHPRTGYLSDINYPGKLGATITCKNIMRDSRFLGKMFTADAISGSAGSIKTGITLTADGYIAATSPTIATPSRVQLTVGTAAITTPGYITVLGTAGNGEMMEEDIYVGLLGNAATATGQKMFKTVTGFYNTGVRSTTGVLGAASIGGGSYYTTTNTTPGMFTLLMQGVDELGNFIKVQCSNCWISSGVFHSGDSGNVLEDAITFEITDLDNDMQIWDEVDN